MPDNTSLSAPIWFQKFWQVWHFKKSQRGEDGLRGWHVAHKKLWPQEVCTSTRARKVVTLCMCAFVSWGPSLCLWPKRWQSPGKPQTAGSICRRPSCGFTRAAGTYCRACLCVCLWIYSMCTLRYVNDNAARMRWNKSCFSFALIQIS